MKFVWWKVSSSIFILVADDYRVKKMKIAFERENVIKPKNPKMKSEEKGKIFFWETEIDFRELASHTRAQNSNRPRIKTERRKTFLLFNVKFFNPNPLWKCYKGPDLSVVLLPLGLLLLLWCTRSISRLCGWNAEREREQRDTNK